MHVKKNRAEMWRDRKAGDTCMERKPARHAFYTGDAEAMETDKEKNRAAFTLWLREALTLVFVTFTSCKQRLIVRQFVQTGSKMKFIMAIMNTFSYPSV